MIYFLRRADGAIKIGYSSDVLKRKASLEAEYGPLEILGVTEGGRPEENALHKRFSLHRFKRTEWFSPDVEILSYVAEYTSLHIPESPNLWTTVAVSRRLAFTVKTFAAALNMSTDEFLWYVLFKAHPEKMTIIEQLLSDGNLNPPKRK